MKEDNRNAWSDVNKVYSYFIDLKIDNLDRVSIPTKIVAAFDVEHPIHGTTYGVWTRSALEIVCLYL